jgi:hypothetical protein
MKKANVFLVMVCLFGVWFTSCVKDNETLKTKVKKIDETSKAEILKKLKTNSYEGSYLMESRVGHDKSVCGGACRSANGIPYHVDCEGGGTACLLRASINISKLIPDDLYDIYYKGIGINTYEPTEASNYYLPSRSLYIEDETFENGYIYLNIPNQLLEREEESGQFIYKDITFSESPLFENL